MTRFELLKKKRGPTKRERQRDGASHRRACKVHWGSGDPAQDLLDQAYVSPATLKLPGYA